MCVCVASFAGKWMVDAYSFLTPHPWVLYGWTPNPKLSFFFLVKNNILCLSKLQAPHICERVCEPLSALFLCYSEDVSMHASEV